LREGATNACSAPNASHLNRFTIVAWVCARRPQKQSAGARVVRRLGALLQNVKDNHWVKAQDVMIELITDTMAPAMPTAAPAAPAAPAQPANPQSKSKGNADGKGFTFKDASDIPVDDNSLRQQTARFTLGVQFCVNHFKSIAENNINTPHAPKKYENVPDLPLNASPATREFHGLLCETAQGKNPKQIAALQALTSFLLQLALILQFVEVNNLTEKEPLNLCEPPQLRLRLQREVWLPHCK
jgi:hypothetical protein